MSSSRFGNSLTRVKIQIAFSQTESIFCWYSEQRLHLREESPVSSPRPAGQNLSVCPKKTKSGCPARADGTMGLFMHFWKSEKWPGEWKPRQKLLDCAEYINMWLHIKTSYRLQQLDVNSLEDFNFNFNFNFAAIILKLGLEKVTRQSFWDRETSAESQLSK